MKNETSALRELKSGFLLIIIAAAVGSAATAFLFITLALITVSYWLPSTSAAVGSAAAFLLILLLAAAGTALYAVFGKIRPGMRRLSEVDGRFRICYTGTTLMLAGLVIMAPALIVLATEFAAAGSSPEALRGASAGGLAPLLLVGGTAVWIGNVLTFAVGAFKLRSRYQNPLYAAAGVLFVIDIALLFVGFSGVLTLVGYMLMYIALKRTLFLLKGKKRAIFSATSLRRLRARRSA
jgi:hypothetical protein